MEAPVNPVDIVKEIPRKQKRKLLKKIKRQEQRQEAAVQRQQEIEKIESDPIARARLELEVCTQLYFH